MGKGERGRDWGDSLPLHREAREGRAPAAHGWPCFGVGERGPDQFSDSLPRAGKLRFPRPRPIPRAAGSTDGVRLMRH